MQFGVAPSIESAETETVFAPSNEGEGYWVGAPCVHTHQGVTYLTVRERTPDERGRTLLLTERVDLAKYEPVMELSASELGVQSIERAALSTDVRTGDLKLYLSVDHGQNDWTIQKLDDVSRPDEFDASTARDVLTPHPGRSDEQTVKDPHLITLGERYVMFYAGHDGRSEQAHMATSHDGERWKRDPNNPVLPSQYWHDHHTRISCVLPAKDAPFWLVFYDGSGVEDYQPNWNLRTGVAITHDLRDIIDTSHEEPRYPGPQTGNPDITGQFGTFRYLDVHRDGAELVMYYEAAAAHGSFELRQTRVDVDDY